MLDYLNDMIQGVMLAKINNIIDREFSLVFLISLGLILLPPFYLIPSFSSSLLTSHTLSRLLVTILFVNTLFYKELRLRNNQVFLIGVYLIYLLFQSISLFGAVNVVSFFQRYKNVVMPGLFLFTLFRVDVNKEEWLKLIFLVLLINSLYQLLLFFTPETVKKFGSFFLYDKHFDLVSINIERGRLFIETFGEVFIPFLFSSIFFLKEKHKKIWSGLGIIFLASTSILSNFRSRLMMLMVSFFGSIIFIKGKKKIKIGILASMFVVFMIFTGLSDKFLGFSIIDRLMFTDRYEDVETVDFRFENAGISLEMGKLFPWCGVGLGNYFDNLPSQKLTNLSYFEWKNSEAKIASTNPHSIVSQLVSETGFVSLSFFVSITLLFAIKDLFSMRSLSLEKRAWVIGFWSLFSFSLFNPTTTMTYNTLFWVFRGVIDL